MLTVKHYTRKNFIYTQQLEQSTDSILQDFEKVYGGVEHLNVIKSPKQDKGISAEWVGSFSYFQKRNPQWDERCRLRSTFLKQLVGSIPQNHLLGIWFSAILPGGVIQWHTDKYDADQDYIRVHLPLIVPVGDFGITVEESTYRWEEGKIFCFDPFVPHTAWNYAESIRLNVNFNFTKQSFK